MYLEEIKKEAQSIARRLKKSALPKAAEVFEKMLSRNGRNHC